MTPLEVVDLALSLAKARLAQAPTFSLYQSIHAQLDYLHSVLAGTEHNRSRLRDLNFGVYAAKEFEDSDPEFAAALHPAYWVASQMAKGLKLVDVPR